MFDALKRLLARPAEAPTHVHADVGAALRALGDVGQALEFLLELRLEEGPLGEEEAYRRLDAWWADRQAGSR